MRSSGPELTTRHSVVFRSETPAPDLPARPPLSTQPGCSWALVATRALVAVHQRPLSLPSSPSTFRGVGP
jgi:hypothetical protein